MFGSFTTNKNKQDSCIKFGKWLTKMCCLDPLPDSNHVAPTPFFPFLPVKPFAYYGGENGWRVTQPRRLPQAVPGAAPHGLITHRKRNLLQASVKCTRNEHFVCWCSQIYDFWRGIGVSDFIGWTILYATIFMFMFVACWKILCVRILPTCFRHHAGWLGCLEPDREAWDGQGNQPECCRQQTDAAADVGHSRRFDEDRHGAVYRP